MKLDRDTEDLRIMLSDSSILDEEGKKWLEMKNKKINAHKARSE